VGVVSDVKQDSLETSTQPAIYYSFAQFSQSTLTTYVMCDVLRMRSVLRWSGDRDQPVSVLPMVGTSYVGITSDFPVIRSGIFLFQPLRDNAGVKRTHADLTAQWASNALGLSVTRE